MPLTIASPAAASTRACGMSMACKAQALARNGTLVVRRASRPAARVIAAATDANTGAAAAAAEFGIFVCSASPYIAEAVCHSGLDWVCLDAQHGPVGPERLASLLAATARIDVAGGGAARRVKRIVRVASPDDRAGMQQALDLGADGVMVPLIHTGDEARRAVEACLYAPQGRRSVAYPVRAVWDAAGAGGAALSTYLQRANASAEVWLQIETAESLDNLEEILSVPGLTCAFLGPSDLSFSLGLAHQSYNYDLAAALRGPEMEAVYERVLAACRASGVTPGIFCLGAERGAALAAQGWERVGYDADLNIVSSAVLAATAALRPGAARA